MNILTSIFNFLKKLIKKLVDLIQKILPYILIACAIWLALGFPLTLPFALGTIPAGYMSAALLAGASFLVAPEETVELVTKIADAVGDAVTAVANTVIDVAGNVASGLLSSPFGLALLGFGAWFLLSKGKQDKTALLVAPTGKREDELPPEGAPA